MILTERDREVISFINKMNCVSTSTIQELFYPSLRVAQHRLKLMYDNNILKRSRVYFTNQYIYYTGSKPRQIEHNSLLADFYKELTKVADVKIFYKEFQIGGVRADAFVGYSVGNRNYIAFVEVELSNSPNVKKYEKLYESKEYRKYFNGVFPLVIYVTDKDIPSTNLKIIKIDKSIDLTGLQT